MLSVFSPTSQPVVGDFEPQPQLSAYLTVQEKAGYTFIHSAGAFGDDMLFVLCSTPNSPTQDFLLFTYSPDMRRITNQYTFSSTAKEHLFKRYPLTKHAHFIAFH